MNTKKIYEITMKNSMSHSTHISELTKYIKYINVHNIEGSIVECGVWKGGTALWMIYNQLKYSDARYIYLYDTFEGMPNPDHEKDDENAKKMYKNISENKYVAEFDKWHNTNKWCYAPLEYVKNIINHSKYNLEKIKYVVGDIIKELDKKENIPNKIAIIRLDTDWYESTKKEFDVLFNNVSLNGIIIVDDYFDWKGSRMATDEFLKENPNKLKEISRAGNVLVLKKIQL